MTENDPLALRPDPALGHLLREGLAGATPDAALAARIRGALAAQPRAPESSWDVLAAWARPGLAAAALVALAVALAGLFAAATAEPEPTMLEAALAGGPAGGAAEVMTAEAPPPSADAMLSALIVLAEGE